MTDSPNRTAPMSDDQIAAVTIGEHQQLNGTIHLAPHNPAWPRIFIQLKNRIQEGLENDLLLLEHVGSTSVPGLSAKPIIDMVLAVPDSTHEAAYVNRLMKKGFVLRVREPDWYEHRLLKCSYIKANLHVFSDGCEEIGRMLQFRDWLCNHEDDRLLYEETKRALAARTWKYTQNYADAKSKVIEEILARAQHQI
jgi:GrpB-like predicted nucleotidyltransferase (UPF0157 family)